MPLRSKSKIPFANATSCYKDGHCRSPNKSLSTKQQMFRQNARQESSSTSSRPAPPNTNSRCTGRGLHIAGEDINQKKTRLFRTLPTLTLDCRVVSQARTFCLNPPSGLPGSMPLARKCWRKTRHAFWDLVDASWSDVLKTGPAAREQGAFLRLATYCHVRQINCSMDIALMNLRA